MAETIESARKPKEAKERSSLSRRLTLLILPLVLIPLLLIGGGAYIRSRQIMEEQAKTQMASALQAQIESLRDWLLRRHSLLYIDTTRQQLLELTAILLNESDGETAQVTREILDEMRYWKDEEIFNDLLILRLGQDDTPEEILISTNTAYEGMSPSTFKSLPSDRIDTLPFFNLEDLGIEDFTFVSSAPLRLPGIEKPDSLLVGINNGLRIGALLDTMQVYWEQRGIYRIERGNTFLLMKPDIAIQLPRYSAEPIAENNIHHPVFDSSVTSTSQTLAYTTTDGEQILAAYQWLPEWNMALVIELPQEQAFSGLSALTPFTILLILLTILLVALLIPLVARRSLKPLEALTSVAEQVASGDLDQRVTIRSKDEIGRLARSFNNMTDELSQLYRSLEQRVLQRTEEIRLAADIARGVTTIEDIDQLLNDVVQLISDRFGYYHAAIFLLDEERENAELRAASSDGGKSMLRRGYVLPVGHSGVVGYVAESGEPRIIQEVQKDILYYANPELPYTKAEAVFPLTASGNVIGAVDIHSQDPNAFSEGDILVIQIIADQLAVAIENTQLLKRQTTLADLRINVIQLLNRINQQTDFDQLVEEIPKAIRETFNLSRVTLGLVEGEDVVVRSVSSVDEAFTPSPIDTSPIGEGVLGRTVFLKTPQRISPQPLHELETQDPRKSLSQTILAIPLILRDRVTGTLALETGIRDDLSKDEIESLEIVAAQAAISLENSQLLEELQKNLDQMDVQYRQQTADSWSKLLNRQREMGGTIIEDGFKPREQPFDQKLQTSIELRGKMIGKLNLEGLRSGEWSEEDLEILEAVADELANALEQARLIEEINRKVTQLQAAAEIARSASSILELETLLARAVNLIFERFGFYHSSIFLLDNNRQFAKLREASGENAAELKDKPPEFSIDSQSVIGKVMSTGKYYVVNEIGADPDYFPNPLLPDARSELGIPLKIGNEVIGALDVIHNQPYAFSEDDISVLHILADQIAIAVQNVYLFEQTLRRAQREKSVVEITSRLRAERDMDKMLQTAILEMQTALGATMARIQLSPHNSDVKPVIHSIEGNHNGVHSEMIDQSKFESNGSD
jgi:GAF domain-containing protein/HAMP domain-containing protein